YVSDRVASRLQCSVARIWSASDSRGRGGISVAMNLPSLVAWQVARQIGERRQASRFEKCRDTVVYLGDRLGIDERGGAHLDGAAPRDEKLQRVLGACDAADSDHRDAHHARGLVGQVDGQGSDRRA